MAVCFLHSYTNAEHERLASDVMTEVAPELPAAFVLRRCDTFEMDRMYRPLYGYGFLGGYGDPLTRPAAEVVDDVING